MSTTYPTTTEDTQTGFGLRPIPESWVRNGTDEDIDDGEVRLYAAAVAWTPANQIHGFAEQQLDDGRFVLDGRLLVRYLDPETGETCGEALRAVRDTHTDSVLPYDFYEGGAEAFRASFGIKPSYHAPTSVDRRLAQHARDVHNLGGDN